MAISVPLSAQVPISAPTDSRMKIAGSPAVTLATAASRRSSIECPCRQATAIARIEQKTSATWFGPDAAASPNRKNDSPSRPTSATTGTSAAARPRGTGVSGRCATEALLSAIFAALPAGAGRRPAGIGASSGYFSSSSFMISAFLVAASASEARIWLM